MILLFVKSNCKNVIIEKNTAQTESIWTAVWFFCTKFLTWVSSSWWDMMGFLTFTMSHIKVKVFPPHLTQPKKQFRMFGFCFFFFTMNEWRHPEPSPRVQLKRVMFKNSMLMQMCSVTPSPPSQKSQAGTDVSLLTRITFCEEPAWKGGDVQFKMTWADPHFCLSWYRSDYEDMPLQNGRATRAASKYRDETDSDWWNFCLPESIRVDI